MQKASKAYRESMKSPIRERAYIMLSFGLINQEAQANAKIVKGDFTHFSNKSNIFKKLNDDVVYATMEENFTTVDGSMYFLPKSSSAAFFDTGLVSKKLISEGTFEIDINLNILPTDFRGLTINFGENYPIDFDIVGSDGQTLEYRDNTMSKFMTEDVLENTSTMKLVFYKMKNPQSRLRICNIQFGYGLVYSNEDIINSTLESYISPIGSDVPQIDFSVTLKNYDKYFNVDNPKSAINFLETGQQMQIQYGYQLPGTDEIEWIVGNNLLCSEWESDDYTAVIRGQDVFRSMDAEYYKGTYLDKGRSYYELAETIIKDSGAKNYYLDPRLKNLFTKNPLPRVKYKEALQIIANACRCTLTQTRNGHIQIKSNFIPESTISSNGEASYSNLQNIFNEALKSEYNSLASNYMTVDGSMYFIPSNHKGNLYTGYVSDVQSGSDCKFTKNPMLTIVQESAYTYHGIRLQFGSAVPAEIVIRTYNDKSKVYETVVSESEISQDTIVYRDFDDFDKMEIEFTKTTEPYNRIVLNYFALGDITDFTMARNDMTSSPKAIKQELVKEVIVPTYSYQKNSTQESLVSEELSVKSGDTMTFYMGEPSYDYSVKVNEAASGANIIASGSYYATVKFSVTGDVKLEVLGYRYKITERYAINSLNSTGKTIKWENPLISDMEMAKDLAEWLGDYYKSGIEYEYSTRGNPEIDANDIVYQENEFHNGMKVNIYRYTIGFKQAFSGKVVARRQGG